MVESVRIPGRRAGVLLVGLVLTFALLPGTALASSPDQAMASNMEFVVDGSAASALAGPVELGRQNPNWKVVCKPTRDGERNCHRWAPGRCKVYTTESRVPLRCVSRSTGDLALL